MNVKIKKLSNKAVLPRKATKGAAAYDVYLPDSAVITAGRQVIPLDFALELPYGYQATIDPRSGFSSKGMEGIRLKVDKTGAYVVTEETDRFNADVIIGKIDSDYRGNVGVIVVSRDLPFMLPAGTRIAQMTLTKVEDADWEEVDTLSETDRGDGGFGHTGAKEVLP